MSIPAHPIPLLCHPANPSTAIAAIDVTLTPVTDGLRIHYRLLGDPVRVRLPTAAGRDRADGLWRHTCGEAFIAEAESRAYREFNFSPSGDWAAYAFGDCRAPEALAGEQLAATVEAAGGPAIALRRGCGGLELDAWLPAAVLPSAPVWQIGLAVVVETVDGELSYWALRHPLPQPDFHHRDAFALRVDNLLESTA